MNFKISVPGCYTKVPLSEVAKMLASGKLDANNEKIYEFFDTDKLQPIVYINWEADINVLDVDDEESLRDDLSASMSVILNFFGERILSMSNKDLMDIFKEWLENTHISDIKTTKIERRLTHSGPYGKGYYTNYFAINEEKNQDKNQAVKSEAQPSQE